MEFLKLQEKKSCLEGDKFVENELDARSCQSRRSGRTEEQLATTQKEMEKLSDEVLNSRLKDSISESVFEHNVLNVDSRLRVGKALIIKPTLQECVTNCKDK